MPIGLFVAVYLLLPVDRTKDIDLKDHYYLIRIWFFLLLLILHVVGSLGTWLFLDVALNHPYRIFQVMLIALVTTGIFAKSHFAHSTIVGLYVAVFSMSQIIVRMNIGALA